MCFFIANLTSQDYFRRKLELKISEKKFFIKVFEGVIGGSFFQKVPPNKKPPKVFEEGYGEKAFFQKVSPREKSP